MPRPSNFDGVLRRALLAFLVFAASALLTTPTAAQWTPTPAPWGFGPQEDLVFQAGSGVTASWGGVQVGPYTAARQSAPGSPFTLYCVDYNNAISVGTKWTANVSGLGDLSNTRLGMAGATDALEKYKRAIWLAAQFQTNQGPSPSKRDSWSDIHAAIWNTTGGVLGSEVGNWVTLADQAAANDFDGFSFANWRVVTDVNATGYSGGVQEYVAYVTPEPSTVILFGTGLAALCFVAYRRREQDGEA